MTKKSKSPHFLLSIVFRLISTLSDGFKQCQFELCVCMIFEHNLAESSFALNCFLGREHGIPNKALIF